MSSRNEAPAEKKKGENEREGQCANKGVFVCEKERVGANMSEQKPKGTRARADPKERPPVNVL